MTLNGVLLAALAAAAVGGSIAAFALDKEGTPLFGGREIHAIDNAPQWLNSEPLTASGLKGKVVLVSFWTYSCINWLRVQPYLRAWAEKYKDNGLVVVGVHTPEFSFEKNLGNVRWAIDALRVDYPVVIDNDFAIWGAFGNQYWPAFYFVDAEGRVRHRKFGEGDYESSERMLQQLLKEAGAEVGTDFVSADDEGLELAADWDNLRTPETYVGYGRAHNFSSPGGARPDQAGVYALPERLSLNDWGLGGKWTVGHEAVSLDEAGGRIAFRFHARDLNFVLGPAQPGASVRFRVLVDGQPPGEAHGVDTDADGYGAVVEQRLYQLVRQPAGIDDRTFEIEFLDAGVEAFSFTFG
jgi:thiol-disulfide isomerase/thioredoxin